MGALLRPAATTSQTRPEHSQVILPFTVLRRLECAQATSRPKMLDRGTSLKGKVTNVDPIPLQTTGHQFYNASPLDLIRLYNDPGKHCDQLTHVHRRILPRRGPGA